MCAKPKFKLAAHEKCFCRKYNYLYVYQLFIN